MSRLPLVAIVLLALLGLGGWWWLTRDTTIYAPSYSERRFSQLEVGMELEDVYSLLGEPLAVRRGVRPETWCYDGPAVVQTGGAFRREFTVSGFFERSPCVEFDSQHRVSAVTGKGMELIRTGMTQAEVTAVLGEPLETYPAAVMTLHYSRPGGENLFRARIVKIDATNRVSDIVTYQFYD
jgi:outer membrane protein assembly factor BamE (lipoprotein component of BamABCDE complex)